MTVRYFFLLLLLFLCSISWSQDCIIGDIRLRVEGEAVYEDDPEFYCTTSFSNCSTKHLESIALQFPISANDSTELVFHDSVIGCFPASNNNLIYTVESEEYTTVPNLGSSHLTVAPLDTFKIIFTTDTSDYNYTSIFVDWNADGRFSAFQDWGVLEGVGTDFSAQRSVEVIVPDTVCNGIRRIRFVVGMLDWGTGCDLSGYNGQVVDIELEVINGQDCLPIVCPQDFIELEPIGSDIGIGVDFIYFIDDTVEINMGSFPNNAEFNGQLDSLLNLGGVSFLEPGMHSLSAIAIDTLTGSICDSSANELVFNLTDSVCNVNLLCDISPFTMSPYWNDIEPDSILPVFSFCPFDILKLTHGVSWPTSLESTYSMEYQFTNQSDTTEQYVYELFSFEGIGQFFTSEFKVLFGVNDPFNEPYPSPGIYKVTGHVYSDIFDTFCQSPTTYYIEILPPYHETCDGCQSGEIEFFNLSDSLICPGDPVCIEITGYSANGYNWISGENYLLGLTSLEDGSVYSVDFYESFSFGKFEFFHASWFQGCIDIWAQIEASVQQQPPAGEYLISGQVFFEGELCSETFTNQTIILPESCWTTSDFSVGLEHQELNWTIYPNPAQDQLYLEFDEAGHDWEVRLLDLAGRAVIEERRKVLNISSITTGVYLLELRLGEALSRKRVVIE